MEDYISEELLDERFDVEEFADFRAKINYSCHSLFDGVFDGVWYLDFEESEDGDLIWNAIEYEDEDDLHGEVVMAGKIVDKNFVSVLL